MEERLHKYLSRAGVASRRAAEKLIAAGQVSVNGKAVTTQGTKVDPGRDDITVQGKSVQVSSTHRYVVLNKPVGYICTRKKFRNERSVYSLVPESSGLAIAGRLDKDSEGLVLLTSDGDLVYQLTHPRFRHEKEYEVRTRRPLLDADLDKLRKGIRLTEGVARADRVIRVNANTVRLVLHQGWKRQIRRMLERLRHSVVQLTRIRIAHMTLGSLRTGKTKFVDREAITASTHEPR